MNKWSGCLWCKRFIGLPCSFSLPEPLFWKLSTRTACHKSSPYTSHWPPDRTAINSHTPNIGLQTEQQSTHTHSHTPIIGLLTEQQSTNHWPPDRTAINQSLASLQNNNQLSTRGRGHKPVPKYGKMGGQIMMGKSSPPEELS